MELLKKITNIYKENGKTFKYHLASVGISTSAGVATAGCLENTLNCSPALNSSITTAVGTGSYWIPFISLLARNEKEEMKDKNGNYDSKKVASKAAQYASFIGIGEVLYAGIRGLVQYQIQKRCNLDAASASALTDLTCATAYGLLVPPISHILKSAGKKVENLESAVNSDKNQNKFSDKHLTKEHK